MRLRDPTADGRAELALATRQSGILLRGTGTLPTTDAATPLPAFEGGFTD
ncbi:hypothetical protein [Streptomyces prasinopilosus]|uniref:Uncharacterized protein n=1 Tax=Streptomyces prasinopilosus TaxID=67344 RepID=A0A1G6XHT4_9ACTN|nr:hypothetical protein [Streptomyces prasinopilosus]SDD76877.1 hypothetical protein SAMN05216505_111208 [Streptomyces prasinopilosus]